MSEKTTRGPISRRTALRWLGATCAAAGAGRLPVTTAGAATVPLPRTRSGASGRGERPNVLFVMTDDHAVQALSCYGGRLVSTPHLDRLATQGARFDNCFVVNSLCCPSRATMLTGKYSHLHGVTENLFGDKPPFDGRQTTYPKLLQEAGYRTVLVGKWHLKSEPTGFDAWSVVPGQGRYRDPAFLEMGDPITHEGYATDVITRLALEALGRLRGERPWCLLVHHKAPHRPWEPHPRHLGLLDGLDVPVPPTFNDDYANRASAAAHADMRVADMPDWRDEQPPGLSPTERRHWNYQRYIKSYLRTAAAVDDGVGQLLEELERSGQARDTVVVYTSDNGFFLGEHGWYDKRFMYEESLRIPLLVRWLERIPAGRAVEEMVLNLDFAETVLDWAGLPIPEEMQGRSLRPLLEADRVVGEGRPASEDRSAGQAREDRLAGEDRRTGEDRPWRTSIYYHYYEYPGPHRVRPHYGVRTGRHKLIRYYTTDEWELFDLWRDPWELNSVHGAPAYAETEQLLRRELRRLRTGFGDDTGDDLPGPGRVSASAVGTIGLPAPAAPASRTS